MGSSYVLGLEVPSCVGLVGVQHLKKAAEYTAPGALLLSTRVEEV